MFKTVESISEYVSSMIRPLEDRSRSHHVEMARVLSVFGSLLKIVRVFRLSYESDVTEGQVEFMLNVLCRCITNHIGKPSPRRQLVYEPPYGRGCINIIQECVALMSELVRLPCWVNMTHRKTWKSHFESFFDREDCIIILNTFNLIPAIKRIFCCGILSEEDILYPKVTIKYVNFDI